MDPGEMLECDTMWFCSKKLGKYYDRLHSVYQAFSYIFFLSFLSSAETTVILC